MRFHTINKCNKPNFDHAESLMLLYGILRSPLLHDIDSSMIIEKISLNKPAYLLLRRCKETYVLIGCRDTFSCDFQCGG